MQITSTLSFIAPADQVAAMMVNPDFAEHVANEIKATSVTSTEVDGGLTSVFTMPSHDAAKRILGPKMTITETVIWSVVLDDESRIGRLSLGVTGVPASAEGPLRLSPTPTGSQIIYDADLSVRIPLVGKKIEQMARKYLTDIIQACESVGNDWLRENPQ